MLGSLANTFVFHGQRYAEEQCGIAFADGLQNCSRRATRTAHGSNDYIGIQDQSHITGNIISYPALMKLNVGKWKLI
jgi:hypothetical protein